jgi:hypothetical protein
VLVTEKHCYFESFWQIDSESHKIPTADNRIGSILEHNQQDATLRNILYYFQGSTCFRRFFRPSSGAQICTCSIGSLSNLFAATACMDEFMLAVAANKFDKYPMLHVQIELRMMGGKTA